jgi:hypothetical protein
MVAWHQRTKWFISASINSQNDLIDLDQTSSGKSKRSEGNVSRPIGLAMPQPASWQRNAIEQRKYGPTNRDRNVGLSNDECKANCRTRQLYPSNDHRPDRADIGESLTARSGKKYSSKSH